MDRLQKIFLKLIAILGVLFFAFLTSNALFTSRKMLPFSETISTTGDNIIKAVVVIIGFVLFFYVIWRVSTALHIFHLRIIAGVLAVISTVGIIIVACNAEFIPIADQEYVYTVVKNLFTGDYTELQTYWYYDACPYQVGVGAVYLLPVLLAGRCSVRILQCFQAVCTGIMIFTGNEIAWRLFHRERVCLINILITLLYIPTHLYALFIYGESVGLCFLYLAIWGLLVIQEKKHWALWKKILGYLGMLACMVISYTAREALVIAWIAVLGILFIRALKSDRKEFIIVALCMILMLLGQKVVIYCVEQQAEIQWSDGAPAISTIAMGFQEDDPYHTGMGTYHPYKLNLFLENGYDVKKCKELSVLNIKQSMVRWMRDPVGALKFFYEKTMVQWTEPTYGVFSATASMENPSKWLAAWYSEKGYEISCEILNQIQNMMYIGILLYYIYLLRGRRPEWEYLPGLILIGEILFSLLWEAKSRYVYPYIVIAIPAMAMGYYYLCTQIQRYISGKKGSEKVKLEKLAV